MTNNILLRSSHNAGTMCKSNTHIYRGAPFLVFTKLSLSREVNWHGRSICKFYIVNELSPTSSSTCMLSQMRKLTGQTSITASDRSYPGYL